ncbi:hypothetical protein FRC02_005207 [Tulasnella sp. 418]|nr:hypothetical protein FRC02_005207 [Tulasnella sp. 418]
MFDLPALQGIWTELIKDTSFFDRAYIVDWALSTFLWVLAQTVKAMPVHEREFSLTDPLISHPHTHEQVSSFANQYISALFPIAFAIIVGALRRSAHEVHHGVLACWSGICIAHLITDILKNRIGRLRPDFLARCAWDAAKKTCTGSSGLVKGGRMSFPSGHSSSAFSGLGFVFLLIAGKTYVLCLSTPTPRGQLLSSKLLLIAATAWPLFIAAWIAITRLEDYRHHKEDIIVGSLIGFLSSFLTYCIYWPNPFSSEVATSELISQPKLVYGTASPIGPEQFELANVEDDDEESVLYDTGSNDNGHQSRGRGRARGRGRRGHRSGR